MVDTTDTNLLHVDMTQRSLRLWLNTFPKEVYAKVNQQELLQRTWKLLSPFGFACPALAEKLREYRYFGEELLTPRSGCWLAAHGPSGISTWLCFGLLLLVKKIAKNIRKLQDLNLRGETPYDFKSDALTTRPSLLH